LPLVGLSVSREHRFLIVIGEWIVEPWFDDRLEGFWRVPSGIDLTGPQKLLQGM